LAAQGGGKKHEVRVSPEFEAWSAALMVRIPITEWFDLDPLLRSMVIGFYRASESYAAVQGAMRSAT